MLPQGRIYWDESQYISLTALIHLPRVQRYLTTHWRHMDCFWRDTALLVTFDEHGGTYDHVPPPPAVPPRLDVPPGSSASRSTGWASASR